ncbi:MAG TPA: zincin-like metallopeptidase domain-containing protein [Terricaulis sp.]|nr:zincin-like metallopeptidase domain-containing protein [Terricaulis sp.]
MEAALARGVRPWARPWRDDAGCDALVLPRRANGQFYRGMNIVALWAAAAAAGYRSPYWFTFKQAQALGAHVRKGERGAFVVFYKDVKPADQTTADADKRAAVRRILRGYVVFNHAQVEGLSDPRFDPPAPAAPSPADDLALRFARVPAIVRFGGASAFYAPGADYIQLPPKAAFIDATQFYATLAHELGHWTRHPTRLARDFGQKRFGDAGYALEELTAELCAAFVGAVIGLPGEHIEDHAAYIGDWLKALQDNPAAFLTAAAKAQAAADYLLRLMGEAPASEAPED